MVYPLGHVLHSPPPPPVCHPPSCVSSFAWGCAQQRVEEPHSVPGYRVRLPEERSLEQPQEVRSACQPHMHAISSSAHRGGHRSVSLCCRTVEDRLPLERVPLACTFGSPLDLHVRQSLGLQGPVDLDHHRVELLIAHQQWFPPVVHNLAVHPGVMWLVQSEPDIGHIGVGGVLVHLPGAFTHCGNRLGSPLCEPAWISIVNTLGSPLPLLSSFMFAILLYILWTLQAMAGHLSAYRGGWGLRSPTRGTYALWEPAWISVV